MNSLTAAKKNAQPLGKINSAARCETSLHPIRTATLKLAGFAFPGFHPADTRSVARSDPSAVLSGQAVPCPAARYLGRHNHCLILENTPEKLLRCHMTIVTPADLLRQNRRRSKRIRGRIPIRVRLQDASKHTVEESTHTVIINDHGALLLLAAAVNIQQVIHIENLVTGKELLCRVANVGPSFMGKTQIAIEFIMPMPGFWAAPPGSKTAESAPTPKK
jgi:hypothetical protein